MFLAAMVVFVLGGIDVPAAFLVGLLTTRNAGLLFCATSAAYYLVYDPK